MANYNRYNDRITGKIIINASLTNETPLLIGKGAGESVDIEALRMPDGKPYIPASSMAGVLKHFMVSHNLSQDNNHFWGRSGKNEKNPLQSHLRIDDLVPVNTPGNDVVMRDGVKINYKTGTAEDKKKYDYQVVEPGLIFPFRAELTIRDSMNTKDVEGFVANVKMTISHQGFRIGAFTNTGFGKLSCTKFQAYNFKFPNDADAWFDYLNSGQISLPEMNLNAPEEIKTHGVFSIEAVFRLKSSLIIGAYGIDGNEPDKSQLKSRGHFILPGKSIRGAIRHRAVKILNTQDVLEAENFINTLFGYVSEDNREQKKGRLRVEEYLFKPDEVEAMEQNRIRIDRFTGGVIDGALFNSEPVWTKGEEAVRLSFTILEKATSDEKKLLLLLLKDLWLEDLAIGGEKNVGRGILTGQEAKIFENSILLAEFKRSDTNNGIAFTEGSIDKINALFQTEQPVL
jgi:CRISPR/Cas system CSM-associated protein Csm3 (group 7 of RAMP superfamily)